MIRNIRQYAAAALCASLVLLAGCSAVFGAFDQKSVAAEGKSRVTLDFSVPAQYAALKTPAAAAAPASARLVSPTVPTIAKYDLYGAYSGETETLLTSFTDPASASVTLDCGTWTFRLVAYCYDGTAYVQVLESTPQTYTVSSSSTTLFFNLYAGSAGAGNVSVTAAWYTTGVSSVVTVFNGVTVTPALAITTGSPYSSVTYTATGVASGLYPIRFSLRDADNIEIAYIFEVVLVRDHLDTTSTLSEDMTGRPLNPAINTTSIYASTATQGSVVFTFIDYATNETGFHVYANGVCKAIIPSMDSSETTASVQIDAPRGPGQIITVAAYNASGESMPSSVTVDVPWLVSYELNGGTLTGVEPSELTDGSNIYAPSPIPVLAGYSFAGWYTDAALATPFVTGAIIHSNVTLYAKWTPAVYYTVSYMSDGSEVQNASVQEGSFLTAPSVTKASYVLAGWYADEAGTILWDFATGTVSGNLVLYAKWVPNTVSAVTATVVNPAAPAFTFEPATLSVPYTLPVTVTATAGFASYQWKLNGTLLSEIGNSCSLDFLTAPASGLYLIGENTLSLIVQTSAGEYYSTSYTFTVTAN